VIGDDIVLVMRQLTMFVKEQDLRNAQAECGLHVEGSKESRREEVWISPPCVW